MSKKRIAALIVALIMSAAVVVLASAADEEVYFTAVNNTLHELRADTMPVKDKSMLYVPWSIFSSKELGTYALYSRESQTVVISNGDRSLYFDMSSGTAYDEKDESYSFTAIYTNDTAYLPAYYTAAFFNIQYSFIRTDYGSILRLSTGGAMSDHDFASGAETLMQTRLSAYKAAMSPEPTVTRPVIAPTPSALPSPVYTDPPQPEKQTTVYLAYLGIGEETYDILDTLAGYGCDACFFISAGQAALYPELIRIIQAEGHSIGALFDDDFEQDYAEASEMLKSAALCRTFITASAHALSSQERSALPETDLVIWSGGARPRSGYEAIRAAEQAEERCCLLLEGDASFTSTVLYSLRQDGCRFERITELTEPEK